MAQEGYDLIYSPGSEESCPEPFPRRGRGQGSKGRFGKAALLLLPVLGVALLAAGCVGGGGLIRWGSGWSPTVAEDGMVYVGTRDGGVLALEANKRRAEILWSYTVSNEKIKGVFGVPAIGPDHIYVGIRGDSDGEQGEVHAIRKEEDDGLIQGWVKPIQDSGGIVGGVALAQEEGLVLVGSDDGNLYAFSVGSGDREWRFATDDRIWSTPTVHNGVVYFGSMDRHVYAVRLDPELGKSERLKWKYKTGGAVLARPLILDNMIIVGSFDKKLYALDLEEGRPLWSFKGGDWFWAGAVSDGERIIAAAMDGRVYALNKGGDPIWTEPFVAESPVISTPAIVGEVIVVGTDEGKLHLLDIETGEKLEVSKDLGSRVKAPIAVDGPLAFVGIEKDAVVGIDVEQWAEVWRVSTKVQK